MVGCWNVPAGFMMIWWGKCRRYRRRELQMFTNSHCCCGIHSFSQAPNTSNVTFRRQCGVFRLHVAHSRSLVGCRNWCNIVIDAPKYLPELAMHLLQVRELCVFWFNARVVLTLSITQHTSELTSPPGGLLTWDIATECSEFVTSFVLDSDIVPRLSVHNMERWVFICMPFHHTIVEDLL